MSDAVSIIGLTLADVKRAMGLKSDNTAHDTFIEGMIDAKADLLVEDIFPVSELITLTPNQKRRAVEGLALLLAADCLTVMPINEALADGGSMRGAVVGPLQIQYNNIGQSISDIGRVASLLRNQGEAILRELRLVGPNKSMDWGAVGTAVRPVYVGGPRRGIRASYGHH